MNALLKTLPVHLNGKRRSITGTSNGPSCPACKARPSQVMDSRPNAEGVRRRRRCAACGYRFTTQERVDRSDALVYVPDYVI